MTVDNDAAKSQKRDSDPRLTAYAFGELSGEDKIRFEAELAGSEEARRELAEIERTLGEIRRELGRTSPPALEPARRERIERAARGDEKGVLPLAPRKNRARTALLGVSSALALAAGAMLLVTTRGERSDSAAVAPMEQSKHEMPAFARPAPTALASAASPVEAKGKFDLERLPSDRESYDKFEDNPFIRVATDPRSTFSIDVDTASYALVRRHLTEGRLPPKGAVRIEEMVNYFSYAYAEPEGNRPFSVQTDVASAPWAPEHRLVRIGIKAKHVQPAQVPGTNLVFLLDVSGSMADENKLPLLKRAFGLLIDQLDERDRVSIVVYAGASGLVLPPTPGNDRRAILGALERLDAGGSTNGGEGIELAYAKAQEHFVKGGINRVILATDGDFNVGTTSQSELIDLIEAKAKSGVFLSVLGFGGGNYNDSMLEKLADKGNGNYAYIDTLSEANKVLVEQATGTLMTVAKDVKIQIEMNPKQVEAFRLIGYENRVLAHQDFNDDKKDAGEIGADHTVTALYEIVPAGRGLPVPGTDPLKYQEPGKPSTAAASGELATIKLRYKQPDGQQSELIEVVVRDSGAGFERSAADFRFAASVAELGMLLRDSPYKGKASYAQVISLASDGATDERRRELVELARKAERLSGR